MGCLQSHEPISNRVHHDISSGTTVDSVTSQKASNSEDSEDNSGGSVASYHPTTRRRRLSSECIDINWGPEDKVWLKEEVPKHALCDEDDCKMLKMFRALDSLVKVNTKSVASKKGEHEATQLIGRITQEFDNEWTCSVKLRGSSTNSLKIGRMDELDYLIELPHFDFKEEDGWQLVPDSLDFTTEYASNFSRNESCNLNSNFQIVVPANQVEAFELYISTDGACLSAKLVKDEFERCLKAAVDKISHTRVSAADTASATRFVFHVADCVLLLFQHGIFYAVKTDITPCVCFSNHDGKPQWLVPRGTFDNWQLVNEDPKELSSSTTVGEAVRVIKALRDFEIVQEALNDYYRNVLIVIAEGREKCHYMEYISMLFSRVIAELQFPIENKKFPSYSILGTVVQQYRENQEQTLCSLVLTSLSHLRYVSPNGTLLCGAKLKINGLNKHCEFLASHIQYILKHETRVKEFLATCYRDSSRYTGLNLKELGPPSLNPFHANTNYRDDSDEDSLDLDEDTWEVYRADKHKFVEVVRSQIPEKVGQWFHVDELHWRLEELSRDDDVQHVTLAVLRARQGVLCFPVMEEDISKCLEGHTFREPMLAKLIDLELGGYRYRYMSA